MCGPVVVCVGFRSGVVLPLIPLETEGEDKQGPRLVFSDQICSVGVHQCQQDGQHVCDLFLQLRCCISCNCDLRMVSDL